MIQMAPMTWEIIEFIMNATPDEIVVLKVRKRFTGSRRVRRTNGNVGLLFVDIDTGKRDGHTLGFQRTVQIPSVQDHERWRHNRIISMVNRPDGGGSLGRLGTQRGRVVRTSRSWRKSWPSWRERLPSRYFYLAQRRYLPKNTLVGACRIQSERFE